VGTEVRLVGGTVVVVALAEDEDVVAATERIPEDGNGALDVSWMQVKKD
jgi:hypothetical protein